jgi:hypothetical protein
MFSHLYNTATYIKGHPTSQIRLYRLKTYILGSDHEAIGLSVDQSRNIFTNRPGVS